MAAGRTAIIVAIALGSAVLSGATFAQAAEAKCGGQPKVCLYDGIYSGYNVSYTCDYLSTYIRDVYYAHELPPRMQWKTTSVINRCPFPVRLNNYFQDVKPSYVQRFTRVFAGEWAVLGGYRRFDGLTKAIVRAERRPYCTDPRTQPPREIPCAF